MYLVNLRIAMALLAATKTTLATPMNIHHTRPAVVNTTSGLFSPSISPAYPDVASFLDIPYAEPPVGPLRFSFPIPKSHTGPEVIQATHLPPGCIQYLPPNIRGTATLDLVTAATFQRNKYANTTEDCLRLSIFAPSNSLQSHSSRLPVIIWIHGGGFSFGGTNTPFALAPSWIQRSQSHIVVQVQYRLNILGLPNAAGLATSSNNINTNQTNSKNRNLNLSILDQRLAIEWVHANIAHFGGDPSRMVLWGESAGAYAVDGYLFAYAHDPLISGVIADSGNAVAIESILADPSNHSTFSLAASRLGCENLAPDSELECMRQVPEETLKQYLQANPGQAGAVDDGLVFGVVPDNVTIFANYTERINQGPDGFAARIPLLTGTNTDEGGAIVPYAFPGSETATQIPPDLARIANYFKLNLQCTTLRERRLREAAGAKTWQYLYAGNFSNISPRPWLGAYHTAELPAVFGTFDVDGKAEKGQRELQKAVSERMQDVWVEFARGGLGGRFGPDGEKVVVWGRDGIVEQVESWDELREECVKGGFEI